MTSRIRRREFIAALGVGLFARPAIVRAEGEPIVIRAGALKLIHSIAPYFYDQFVPAGYKIEVLPFETPTECKNAVVQNQWISAVSELPPPYSVPRRVSRLW